MDDMGQPSVKTHEFHERLNFSMKASHEPFWQEVYSVAFPDMEWAEVCSAKCKGQELGIDRLIYLKSGKVLKIDEKKRERDYGDIFLEYVSNDQTGALGWIEKELQIDYLAYAFMPSKTCHLFPWQILRRAWITNKHRWLKRYKTRSAKNKTYYTLGVPIPTNVLKTAAKDAMTVTL